MKFPSTLLWAAVLVNAPGYGGLVRGTGPTADVAASRGADPAAHVPCPESARGLVAAQEASEAPAVPEAGPVLWSNKAADRAAFVPTAAVWLEGSAVRTSELIPEKLKDRLEARVVEHEELRSREARAAQIRHEAGQKAAFVPSESHFDFDSDSRTSVEPIAGAVPLAAMVSAAQCAVVIRVQRVDYGWRDLGLGPAAAIHGWSDGVDDEPADGCPRRGDALVAILPGGWFEWEGIPFHSQRWLGLRRPAEGEAVLVLGRAPAEWDASNGLIGLEVDHLFVVEDEMVLPQPYPGVRERAPVPLATVLAGGDLGRERHP